MIACAQDHSLAVDIEGNVWSFGLCSEGRLGLGKEFNSRSICRPWKLKSLKNIVQVSCGYSHSICVEADGTLWSFGNNSDGRLGIENQIGASDYFHIPVKIQIEPIYKVSCGLNFTICIDKEGFIWSFGNNSHGALGQGRAVGFCSIPRKLPSLTNIHSVSCGDNHVICIDSGNKSFGFGNNEFGKLGLSGNQKYYEPTLISSISTNVRDIVCSSRHSLILLNDGTVYGIGDVDKLNFSGLKNIKMISCGETHNMVVDEEGKLFLFGNNSSGQLGCEETFVSEPWQAPFENEVIRLSKGGCCTIIKESNGTLSATGRNNNGNLGVWNMAQTRQFTPLREQFSNLGSAQPIGKKSARK